MQLPMQASLSQLYEKLKLMLLPRDPLDDRNIMLVRGTRPALCRACMAAHEPCHMPRAMVGAGMAWQAHAAWRVARPTWPIRYGGSVSWQRAGFVLKGLVAGLVVWRVRAAGAA